MARGGQKAQPFSIRLRTGDDRFVRDEARRLSRSRGAIVEAFAQEAITQRRYPGIAFRGDDYRRRAYVLAVGLDVWEIVALLRDFGSEAELEQEYGLTPGQIRIALAYSKEFAEEIDDLVARGRRSEDELLSRYPFIQSFEEAAARGGP